MKIGRRINREDRELIPAEPRQYVHMAESGGKDLRRLSNGQVALQVAEGIIDLFQLIKIREEDIAAPTHSPGKREALRSLR